MATANKKREYQKRKIKDLETRLKQNKKYLIILRKCVNNIDRIINNSFREHCGCYSKISQKIRAELQKVKLK